MGPILLLDKSTLQSFSKNEISFLCKHYLVVLPPILVVEIIADYAKFADEADAKLKVGILADKLEADFNINMDYRRLSIEEMHGNYFPLDGRPVLEASGSGLTPDGEKSVLIDESPWTKAARHWQMGEFKIEDIEFANRYRTQRDMVDLAKMAKELARDSEGLPKFSDYADIVKFSFVSLQNPDANFQCASITNWLKFLGVEETMIAKLINRWMSAGKPFFRQFAPFSHYCYMVMTIISIALCQGMIATGKKRHSMVDVEYLFYLPFCNGFCSYDKFHISIVPDLLRKDQVLIMGKMLKEDLRQIGDQWKSMGDGDRIEFARKHRHRPPHNPQSITHQLWRKYMKPEYPAKKASEIPREKQEIILKKLKEALEAAKKNSKQTGDPEYHLY